MSLVNICGLRKSYNHSIVNKVAGDREYPVLRGIDFHVEKGDFIGIMGHSGCGKTTLLKIMGTIDNQPKGRCFMRMSMYGGSVQTNWRNLEKTGSALYSRILI